MRGPTLLLMLLCTPLADPALADPVDVLVWGTAADGYETTWIRVDGEAADVVAKRPEAVASDGATLWALRHTWKKVDMLPCSALEEEDGARRAEPAGTAVVTGLLALPLGGGKAVALVEASTSTGGYGEVWNNAVELLGGAGGRVSVRRDDSGFGCGAHGFVDSRTILWDLPTGAEVKIDEGALAGMRAKATPGILADASKEGCLDADVDGAGLVSLSGVGVVRKGETIEGRYAFVLPTQAEWAFNCEIVGTVDGPLLPATGLAAPDPAVAQAVRAAGVLGTVGYARLHLQGDARDRALAAFRDATGIGSAPKEEPARPSRSAGELIDAGRKATRDKDYTAAVTAFDQAIAADSRAARAWSGRGYARLLAGQLDAAKDDLERALTLDTAADFQAAVWFNLGLVAEKQGDREAARAAYGKANTLKPSKAARGKLDALK